MPSGANSPQANGRPWRGWPASSSTPIRRVRVAQAPAETVRDEFSVVSYANNNGTQNWSSNWIEANDDGTAAGGYVRVESGRLTIKGNNRRITRSASLSSAASATLSYQYRRYDDFKAKYVALQISPDGGATWVELRRFTGLRQRHRHVPASHDISAYLSANTTIRFVASSDLGLTRLYVDNVQIEYIVPPPPPGRVLRDEFKAVSYRGNDGTQAWSGPWIEHWEY